MIETLPPRLVRTGRKQTTLDSLCPVRTLEPKINKLCGGGIAEASAYRQDKTGA